MIQIEKEKVKLYSLKECIILNIKDPIDSTRKFLDIIKAFNKVEDYKIFIKYYQVFHIPTINKKSNS